LDSTFISLHACSAALCICSSSSDTTRIQALLELIFHILLTFNISVNIIFKT